MPGSINTYLYVHAIWCTAGRHDVISQVAKKVLFPYMKQSAEQKGMQVMAVNGAGNHVHCIFKLLPTQSVSEIVNQLKSESGNWLNSNKFLPQIFEWEDIYSAYSVSPSAIDKAIEYINNQEEYHKTKSLDEELAAFDKMVVQLT